MTSGKSGFSIKYSLVDPYKMDHLIANISLQGLLGPLDDKWSLLRLRKVLGATNQVGHNFVIFDNIDVNGQQSQMALRGSARIVYHEQTRQDRRSNNGRRLLQSTSMTLETRMLANSPLEVVTFAKDLTQALLSRTVTTEMNNQGIVGNASLIGKVKVFRCGYELECVPRPPISPSPVEVVPNITLTPEPFPIDDIVRLALALIVGPVILGFCCCLAIVYYGHRDRQKKKEKRITAIDHWTKYLQRRKKELLGMDTYDRKKVYLRVLGSSFDPESMEDSSDHSLDVLIKTEFATMADKEREHRFREEYFKPFEHEDYKMLPESYYQVSMTLDELVSPSALTMPWDRWNRDRQKKRRML